MGDNKQEDYRLKFHIMPPKGWLNDPNGLCYYKGEYHVFFQYSPEEVLGGLKSWGHYVSKDLIHWTYLGEDILPDTPWEKDGSYSGCAYVGDGIMELFYTGNAKEEGDHDYVHTGRGANIIYVTSEDGRTFSEKELLLTNADYPDNYTCHVRDPKVWKEGNTYYMVLGGRKDENVGAVLVYRSLDKKNWEYDHEITTTEPFGYMWECPDMFTLDGHQILSLCPQGVDSEEYRYENIHQSGYFICDGEKLSDFYEWDYGFDFYAPQTFDDGKRRILVGWAGVPDMDQEYNNAPTIEVGWQHSLTLFRELSWKNGKVYQYPVEEYQQLRKEGKAVVEGENTVSQTYDCEITFSDANAKKKMVFGKSLELCYESGVVTLHFLDDSGSGRTTRKAKLDGLSDIRIMMDTSMVELYLNHGKMVFTTRWFGNTEDTNTLEIVGDVEKGQMWTI